MFMKLALIFFAIGFLGAIFGVSHPFWVWAAGICITIEWFSGSGEFIKTVKLQTLKLFSEIFRNDKN